MPVHHRRNVIREKPGGRAIEIFSRPMFSEFTLDREPVDGEERNHAHLLFPIDRTAKSGVSEDGPAC